MLPVAGSSPGCAASWRNTRLKMTLNNHCNSEQLLELLNEALAEPDESDVSEHVAICPQCQRALEELAAGESWWEEASQRLSSRLVQKTGDADHSAASHDDDSHHFATDFAVDFLEPSNDSKMLGRLGE